ncbi:MAG: UrcA family protein [Hyphomonas sp.]
MKRFIIAAALAAATLSAPAFAASDTFKMEVSYSGKNLSSRSGAEAEYQYIRNQVADRCTAEHAEMRFVGGYAQAYCVRKTMDRAVNSIGNPLLTEVHAESR